MKSMYIFGCLMVISLLFACCSDGNNTDNNVTDGDKTETESSEIDGDSDEVEPEIEQEAEIEKEVEAAPKLWEDLKPSGEQIADMLGVSTHMGQRAGENEKRDFEFEKYVELGGIWIRQDYHWHKIEPADDEWHMEAVIGQVEMAEKTGVKILGMLAYSQEWPQKEKGNYSSVDVNDYAQYAGKVAKEYCGRVQALEIWNEPNIVRFWKPEADPEYYGRMLKAAYTEIKKNCPETIVLSAGLASWDESWFEERWGFMREVYENHPDICDYFDVFGIHPYTFFQKVPPEHDSIMSESVMTEGQSWQHDLAVQKLTKFGCPEKPIWYTEMGWPSYSISEEDHGRYVPRSFAIAAKDGVQRYFWYTFWDGPPTTTGLRPHEDYFGLFGWAGNTENPRRVKPAYTALLGLYKIAGDARFARDLSPALELPNDVYVYAFLNEAGDIVLTMWDGRDVPDMKEGIQEPGGADTKYDLKFGKLPEGAKLATLYDIAGEKQGEHAIDSLPTFKLTPSMQYLVIKMK